jgi:pyruvate dehydrogenase E1 component alpha subunit
MKAKNIRRGSLLWRAARIRAIELAIADRYKEGKMRTPVHLSVGQETVAVGVCASMRQSDCAVSTHRGHAHYLACGGDVKALIAELYGKEAGCSGGYGGSMHLTSRDCGFVASTSIVAGTIPVGVGIAWANKLARKPGYVYIFLGDAAIEEGVFHEAANFAGLHELKVIFAVENNGYSCFTPLNQRQPKRPINAIAKAHKLRYMKIENKSLATMARNIYEFKKTNKPILLEIKTFRFLEHCGPNNDDHLSYRSETEIEKWKDIDVLKDVDLSEFKSEIDEAFQFAEESSWPNKILIKKTIYAERSSC